MHRLLLGAREALICDEIIQKWALFGGGLKKLVGKHDVTLVAPCWRGGACDEPLSEELIE